MNFLQSTVTGKPDFDPLVDSFELLMKLYPDEHPANLHGVMCVTNNNIVEAMKLVQYYREMSKQQLPPSMMSTYVSQASPIMPTSVYKTQNSMSANEVQFPSSMNTDQLSASMYSYKTQPTMSASQAECQTFTNIGQQLACMYPYQIPRTISAHEAQIPTSANADQLAVSMVEQERFMHKYEPELSKSLYQPSIPASQHMYSLFDEPFSMSSEDKQCYNTTCTGKSSAFPHDLYRFLPLLEPELCCPLVCEPQSSLPVFDPQFSTSSSEVPHSSSVSDASGSQPLFTTFDSSTTSTNMTTTSTDLNTTATDLNATSTDLNTTSTVESSENLEQGYAVCNSSPDDDTKEYIVLVPVDDQEMELTPSGLTPPAYRMTSVFRGRNGQFMKNLD